MKIEDIINHARNRAYMNGVDRDKTRVKETQEVFTPTVMVNGLLDQLPKELFSDVTQTVIDNSCGDGQFLSEALIRKVEAGADFETALSTIYGVDMMQDNVDLCRERLLCGREDLRHIVERNIVCHNALTYDYSFGEIATFGNGLFSVA
jgi:type I restriction-modification system DNA methylase subunit